MPTASELIRNAGIPVAIYAAVGGWVSGLDFLGRRSDMESNLAILDEAVELGATTVSVLGGGLTADEKNLDLARARVVEGLVEIGPFAAERGLKLAIEPLHPIYAPDKDVLMTLSYALDIVEEVAQECIGLVVDTYHHWWEPDLLEQLRRAVAGKHVFLVQLSDWPREVAAMQAFSRVLMGEGCVNFEVFLEGLEGYDGPLEIEVLRNEALSRMALPDLIERVLQNYQDVIGSTMA